MNELLQSIIDDESLPDFLAQLDAELLAELLALEAPAADPQPTPEG